MTSESLLARLLDAWRATHDPALEPWIQRLGARLTRDRGELTGTPKQIEIAWKTTAARKDPVDLDRLLAARWPVLWRPALERIEVLATFPPDPRISTKVAQVAQSYTPKGSRVLHQAIATLVARAPTAAALPGIAAATATRRVGLDEIYDGVARAIAALVPTTAEPALLDEAKREIGDVPELATLHAQHRANPGDLGSRVVLADALQLAGDPRGELIALQMAIDEGSVDPDIHRRVAALIETHADTWTGGLPAVDRTSRRFERGFLVAFSSNARGSRLDQSLDCPEWATIEELFINGHGANLAGLLDRTPVLRALTLRNVEVLVALEACRRTFPSIRCITCYERWRPSRKLFPNLAVVGEMGRTYIYEWDPEPFRVSLRAAKKLDLDALVHMGLQARYLRDAIADRALGPREIRLTLDGDRDGLDPTGWRIRVHRDRPAADVAWSGGTGAERDGLDVILRTLAGAGIDELAVHGVTHDRPDLVALIPEALERFGRHVSITPGAPIQLFAAVSEPASR